ncbi:MAG TPA: DUF1611 domain-containing protein [Pelomicrobium sp.]|nr:DUF1611 domain-containing protein [Pelomicrobium sp.]
MIAQNFTLLDHARIAHLKTPYSARRIPVSSLVALRPVGVPEPGDLVLARIDRPSQHKHLELACGRRARLFPGDEIVLVYGNRYAPDQFEALVPDDLGPCHMVAAGGIAARMVSRHSKMRPATTITPLGLICDRTGRTVNLRQFALPVSGLEFNRPPVIAVVGTSMNAGKTETATNIIRGLSEAGMRVGAAKVTGTGAGGDAWSMADAGATMVLDFVDAGLPSTYRAPAQQIEQVLATLVNQLARSGAEAIVLEIADGLFQDETAALVRSRTFKAAVDRVVFAAGDAMGALAGVQWLRESSLPVAAVAGVVTSSPLATREAAAATGLRVLGLDALSSPEIARHLSVAAAAAPLEAVAL